MLDANSAKSPAGDQYRLKAGLISVVALLILSTGAYYFFTPGHKQDVAGNESSSRQGKLAENKPDLNANVRSQNTKAIEKTIELPSSIKNRSEASKENTLTESKREAVTQSRVDRSANVSKITPTQNAPTQKNQLALSKNDVTKYENVSDETQKQTNKIEEPPKNKNDFSGRIENVNENSSNSSITQNDATVGEEVPDLSAKNTVSNKMTTSLLKEDSVQKDSSVAKLKKTKKVSSADSLPDDRTPTRLSRWSALLTLAPEFSTSGMHKFTSPGNAFGIVGYYHLNDALSFSLGVIKSSKIYSDDGSNYKPALQGYWAKKTNGIVPNKIDGTCSLLEIPLGIQYYISRNPRSKMYVAASFSSYVMLEEYYQYTFSAPNPGAVNDWNARKPSHSLFNIASFSAGYERIISKQLAIGVSPYIKIPVAGVGVWANVKLYSMGAAFTVRYQFQKRKQVQQLSPARSPD